MAEYIEKSAAVVIADYSADEHPYSKDPEHPETYSDYNQGWNDACDYIRGKLEDMPDADVAQVRHGRWETISDPEYVMKDFSCSACEELICDFDTTALWPGQNCYYYCPCCGAKMDGGTNA